MAIKKHFDKIFKKEIIVHSLNIIIIFILSTGLIKLKIGLPSKYLETLISFLIILSLSVALFLILKMLIKDSIKASLLLSYILFVTLFFRDIAEILIYYNITDWLNIFSIFVGELFFVVILLIILLAVLTFWLYKTNLKLFKLNSYLNLLTAIFLIVEIFGFYFSDVSKVELKEKIELKPFVNNTIEKPDIYFIILDGYTGFSGLKKFWNYNNSSLKSFLHKKGFFVAENARTLYNVTNYAIASTFNMTELIYDINNLYAKSHYLLLAHYIKNNKVVKNFANSGYDFINLSFFDILNKKRFYEDIYFLKTGNIYQARTLYGYFYELYNETFGDMAETNLDIFNRLGNIGSSYYEMPKFIYAHIMMPHPPYYFDAEGNRTDFKYSNDSKNKHNYLKQLKFTNKLLMKTIQSILSSSEKPPIIIVQSDHGFRGYSGDNKNGIELSVLNCIYFPDQDYSLLTDSTLTKNTFKIIFSKYFNQKFESLN